MAQPRFYIPDLAPGESPLPEDQDHHARNVLRMEHGDAAIAFNGRGLWGPGQLRLSKRSSCFVSEGDLTQDSPPWFRLTVATAAPKADRAMQLVEQLSQIGVSRLVWIITDRGVAQPEADGGKMTRFRRLAVESAKQARRNFLMEILPPISLRKFLVAPGDAVTEFLWTLPGTAQTLFDWTAGGISRREFHTAENPEKPPQSSDHTAGFAPAVLIGPEGGWSDEEAALLSAHGNVHPVRLTPTILRIETAAAVAAAMLCTAWQK